MKRRQFLTALAALVSAPLARAGGWSSITSGEATQALRESLGRGVRVAIAKLGQENGFFGNPRVKIGLHKNLAKADGLMRRLGMGKKLDELVLASNRAAEAAVTQAQGVVLEALEKMSVVDAKAILAGGEGAATAWFRRNTEAHLSDKLLPIVQGVAGRTDLVRAYQELASKLEALTGSKSDIDAVEIYITRKALDGLYMLIADEERAIRTQPLNYTGSLLGKVFSAIE